MSATVQKELYIPAPRQGVAVYAMGQAYTPATGGELIETLPEQPRTSGEDFTADCYRYVIGVE